MGAKYTKSQAQASVEYLKKFDEIKIRVSKGKKEEYRQLAIRENKSLNQFIIDKIEN